MEEQKMNKINEQDAEVVNDDAAQTVNEKAARDVQVDKDKKLKRTKIIAAVIGGTVVACVTVAGVVHFVKKGQIGKAAKTIEAAGQAIPELAQSAMTEAPKAIDGVVEAGKEATTL